MSIDHRIHVRDDELTWTHCLGQALDVAELTSQNPALIVPDRLRVCSVHPSVRSKSMGLCGVHDDGIDWRRGAAGAAIGLRGLVAGLQCTDNPTF